MALKSINLTGEQKKVLFLPATNPIQIKGVAGSGKTTIAMYRAKHLLDTYSDLFREAEIMIFTYNNSLTQYIQSLLPNVISGYQESNDFRKASIKGLQVKVSTFHKWSYGFLRINGVFNDYAQMERSEHNEILSQAISESRKSFQGARILNKPLNFFDEEISWIKGQLIKSQNDYLSTARIGRGTKDRVNKNDKAVIWNVYKTYRLEQTAHKKIHFDDHALYCLNLIERRNIQPKFSHIVVDEAQDLNKAQIMVIKSIVKPTTNSLTIIADIAQRIYKSGFSWTEVGINVRGGRTVEFKKNYRNTKEIALAANSLMSHDLEDDDLTTMDIDSITSHGDKPVLNYYKDADKAKKALLERIREARLTGGSIVVLHRYRNKLDYYAKMIQENDIPSEVIRSDKLADFSSNTVKICTLSSVKGLEFDHVIIMELSNMIIPSPDGFGQDDDEYHITTERKLLYTAMTRAQKSLCLFVPRAYPSVFINEINKQYLTVVR
jgi:superfamily I DNA/RNA helicase